ncbi:MAG: membrane protein insertion efficiency factor YidD [Candidatus Yonathbacteria bacterium]|nr:membrane protein insertion efficiency factor YidD [Candidatus Yonathbacteria bacterium]
MRAFIVFLISFYQKTLSPDTGVFSLRKNTTCVFYPTCSEYTKEAIMRYGVLRGVFLGTKRIARCHPLQKNHIDPLP